MELFVLSTIREHGMSERLALFELTYPVLVLYFLESQSLISVGEEDDTTILNPPLSSRYIAVYDCPCVYRRAS